MQDAQELYLQGGAFKLTWDTASERGLRTECVTEACTDMPRAFALHGTVDWPLYGSDSWTMTFSAGDNRFVETQGEYTEDKGVRTMLVSVHFGYCSLFPLDPRR